MVSDGRSTYLNARLGLRVLRTGTGSRLELGQFLGLLACLPKLLLYVGHGAVQIVHALLDRQVVELHLGELLERWLRLRHLAFLRFAFGFVLTRGSRGL
jgi:hypothetical protein